MTTPHPSGYHARPARYRLYIDESGDHTYKLLDDPSHRYLALLGIWFRQADDYIDFSDELSKFKRNIFGERPDKPVILHRSDIINRKGPFGILCDQKIEAAFNEGLLRLISESKFKMVCIIIDKKMHLESYQSPFHPYHYCLAAMLDRYSGWLSYKNAVGDVLAESRGREENIQLEQAYQRVYKSGTLMFDHEHHQKTLTTKKIKIREKRANIPGLQLADMLAHPIKQLCLIEEGLIPDLGDNFGKIIADVATPKFNINECRNEVLGYGKVWLPWRKK